MEELLIFPYSGTGIEALDCLGSKFTCTGFITDDSALIGTHKWGIPLLGREALTKNTNAKVLAVPGGPTSYLNRKGIIADLRIDPSRFTQVIHPAAVISSLATIGQNVLIMAGVVITSNVTINKHVCLLPNTVIHHDTSIGSYSLIGANVTIAGNVIIGNTCYIGASTSIKNGIQIGDNTLVGMGSNVINSIPANSKIAGNPARDLHHE